MSRNPDDRPKTAGEIRVELEQLAGTTTGIGVEPLHGYVATALTGLTAEAREGMAFLSSKIAEVAKHYGIFVYQPRRATDPLQHKDVDPLVVYQTDRKRVVAADIVFFVLNAPSFGLGQELEISSSYGKPAILVARPEATVSRMVLGSYANVLATIRYETPEALDRELRRVIRENVGELRLYAKLRRSPPVFKIGQRLADLRDAAGFTTVEELAEELHLPARLIHAIESGELDNPGVQTLAALCRQLGTSVGDLLGPEDAGPVPEVAMLDVNVRRLENFAKKADLRATEYFTLRDELQTEVAAKGSSPAISDAEWVRRPAALGERRLGDAGIDTDGSDDSAHGDDDSAPRLL